MASLNQMREVLRTSPELKVQRRELVTLLTLPGQRLASTLLTPGANLTGSIVRHFNIEKRGSRWARHVEEFASVTLGDWISASVDASVDMPLDYKIMDIADMASAMKILIWRGWTVLVKVNSSKITSWVIEPRDRRLILQNQREDPDCMGSL